MDSGAVPEDGATKWDFSTQEYHGGQTWTNIADHNLDLSVTTNGLGMLKEGIEEGLKALYLCHHYPPSDQEPAKTSLAKFLTPDCWESTWSRMILGNGASELVDLVTRLSPPGPWKPGPSKVQYMEYHRSAKNAKREICAFDSDKRAKFYAFVNPTNPTGDYLNLPNMKNLVESLPNDCTVVVDESMQPWHSMDFRSDSLTSEYEWIKSILEKRNIALYIIHSWTKLWTCCGLRIGSIIAPSVEHLKILKSAQVPWSVNTIALKYLEAATDPKNIGYLENTWSLTKAWRKYLYDELAKFAPSWDLNGENFLSWIWINTKSEEIANKMIQISANAGIPIRPGKYGYCMPTYIRIAVREFSVTDKLISAWRKAV